MKSMRGSNFVVGLGLSAVLHGVALYVLLGHSSPPAAAQQASGPPVTPVQIAAIDPQEKLPLEPVELQPPPVPVPAPAPEPELPSPAPLPLERVVEPQRLASLPDAAQTAPARPRPEIARAAATPAPALGPAPPPAPPAPPVDEPSGPVVDSARTQGNPVEGTGDFTPPLRVHWRDAGELIRVARTLGMRLAAVNRAGDIVGEVVLTDPPALKKWHGLPYGYSNRVRMLSPSIFSARIGGADGEEVGEIWVFVPSDRDRAMVEAQKDAVRRAGARVEDVVSVDGKFVRAANGSYRLDIINIRWRDNNRRGSGRNG